MSVARVVDSRKEAANTAAKRQQQMMFVWTVSHVNMPRYRVTSGDIGGHCSRWFEYRAVVWAAKPRAATAMDVIALF